MDLPLQARTFNEVKYYLMVAPCADCGKGPLSADPNTPPGETGKPITMQVRCRSCKRTQSLTFVYDHPTSPGGAGMEYINPTDQPSRIVDLSQWLSLFHLLVESAWRESSAPRIRRGGFQAALCLGEALKFYGDDELPPPSAFFTPQGAAAFQNHPEKFAKQRLRDMQGKLPALPKMARRIDRDEKSPKRRWWRFGKR